MLSGHLDEMTSSGQALGWACDMEKPAHHLMVSIRDDEGRELGWGLAHRYREDLAAAGIGLGWCAFRIRTAERDGAGRDIALALHDRETGSILHGPAAIAFSHDDESPAATTESLVRGDPTIIHDIGQLRGCDALFSAFIKARGVSAFVRTVYIYVLGRSADDAGLGVYGGLIRKAALAPYDLLAILADSDEFRSRPRSLGAPNTPHFPFRVD